MYDLIYFVVGFLIGGGFFANRQPHMPRPCYLDFAPPVFRLASLSLLVAVAWPAFLVMLVGYSLYKFVLPSDA